MYQGIPVQNETMRSVKTIGGGYVLPEAPPSPNLKAFDEVNIARDTLPARNAMTSMGEIGTKAVQTYAYYGSRFNGRCRCASFRKWNAKYVFST